MISLTTELEKCVSNKDVSVIIDICAEHNDFITHLTPSNEEDLAVLTKFKKAHEDASRLLLEARTLLKNELKNTRRSREGVRKYKGFSKNER